MSINYAIFAFNCSNPHGGASDLYDTSDTLENAIKIAEDLLTTNSKNMNLNCFPQIAQIMCLKTCKIVKKINLSDLICKASKLELQSSDDDESDGYVDVTTYSKKEIQYVVPVRVRPILYKGKTIYLQNVKNTMILYKENDPENIEYSLCHYCKEIKLYLEFKIINGMYICRECRNL
jgi:hypothetical protein